MTIHYKNANVLDGIQKIKKDYTAIYDFTQGQAGYCLNLNSFNLGLVNESGVGPIRVYTMDTATWATLVPVIKEFSDDASAAITSVGDALKEAQPEAAAAMKAVGAVAKLGGSIAKLAAQSTCKNISFMVIKDKDGLVAFTKDVDLNDVRG